MCWQQSWLGDTGTPGPCTVDGCALLRVEGGSPEATVMARPGRGMQAGPTALSASQGLADVSGKARGDSPATLGDATTS